MKSEKVEGPKLWEREEGELVFRDRRMDGGVAHS